MDQAVARLLQQAAHMRSMGRLMEAGRLANQALALQPGEPQTLNLLGLISLERGAFQDAQTHFLEAVEAEPGEAALWMNLASSQRAMSDDSGEENALKKALALDQRNLMAHVRMAELKQRQSEGHIAAEHWNKVIALAGNLAEPPAALVKILGSAREFVRRYNDGLAVSVAAHLAQQMGEVDAQAKRRFQACLDKEFGRRIIYQNECHGLHYPFLPADEFFDRGHFPWMAALEAQTGAIRAEFLTLIESHGAQLRPYVRQEPGTPKNKWTPLSQSLDWGAIFLWEYGVANDAVLRSCPKTVAALENLPRADISGRAPSVFFSILKPGSHIPPHTGMTNSRAIIHLPLIVPGDCAFRVGGETRPWREGEAFAFDDTIEHEAWNNSDEMRVVLIFDVWNPHLTLAEQALLKQFYSVADAWKQTHIHAPEAL